MTHDPDFTWTSPAVPAESVIGKRGQSAGEHTPGPWRTNVHDFGVANGSRPYVGIDTDNGSIAWVLTNKEYWERGTNRDHPFEANARLIAAAPELKTALEPFADVDGEGDEDFPDDTKVTVTFGRTTFYALTLGDFRRARAAMAKAER